MFPTLDHVKTLSELNKDFHKDAYFRDVSCSILSAANQGHKATRIKKFTDYFEELNAALTSLGYLVESDDHEQYILTISWE